MTKITLNQVQEEAQKLAKVLKGGEVVGLIGPLGSGKTTFTKALAKSLGITQNVTSPTFVIMQEYPLPDSKLWLYHLDVYRVEKFEDLKALDLTEIWQKPQTITIIEWADKIKDHLPKETIYYYLSHE